MGEPKNNLHISFGKDMTRFKFRPLIVKDFSGSINISGPFLKRHHIDQIHTADSLCIQGKLVPLYSSLPCPTHIEAMTGDIITDSDLRLPPLSVNHVSLIVPQIVNKSMPASAGMVNGSISFMAKHDCHPWLNALATPTTEGRIRVGLINSTNETIVVPAKTRYGSFVLTCSQSELSRYPWRISTIHMDTEPLPGTDDDEDINQTNQKSKSTHTGINVSDHDPYEKKTNLREAFLQGPTTKTNERRRLEFIITHFELDKSPFLKMQKDKERAAKLLLRFWTVFSFDGSFGATDLIEHKIYTEDVPPINQRYRPINPSLEPHLEKQIQDWLEHDVIERSNSPYNFGLVCVPKKNGKFRWCIDYRELNKISKRDTFPIGSIEDNLARLATSKVFSGLDGSGAFHVIPLEEQSKEKTAFATPFGSYQFKRLPFGLANGPATYARLIKMVLNCLLYTSPSPRDATLSRMPSSA